MAISDIMPWRRGRDLERMDPFSSLQREINRTFEDFLGFGSEGITTFRPSIDVNETDEAYEVTAELPGMEKKDITVTVENGLVTLRGEKRVDREEKKKNYHFTERSYGSFQRALRLPGEVDADKINAHFERGVLHVLLPKTAETRRNVRRIEVKG